MLKSLSQGYGPALVIAAFGSLTVGGSALAWLAFVWIFGAVLTIAIAALRMRPTENVGPRRPISVGIQTYSAHS